MKSDSRSAVDMKSKQPQLSSFVKRNGINYNLPDMKGWKGMVLGKVSIQILSNYKDLSETSRIDSEMQKLLKISSVKEKVL